MNDRLAAKPESGLPAAVAAPVKGGGFQITPFMALAVSLIYMLTADGEIDDHESSQLQAVVGGHNELLDISIAYAEENSVEQFLKETSGLLNQEDHWCILANLCDCLLSDGVADDHELTLFRQISEAFGVSEMSFKTHFINLSFKNNKSLLGKFSSKSLTLSGESAHLTLACSLLYMMAADGNIAEEEIGQLQVVLGEFEGLQAVAMQTVRTVKMNVFLRQAAPLLTQDQKIMILSNVCDSMMSDGKVDVIEDNLFQSMLAAFSVPMSVFKSFYETIKIKCIKPFDTESIPTAFHSRVASKKKNDQSGSFKIRHQKKSADDAEATGDSSGKPEGDWVSEVDQKQLSAVVHRTMQDNIKQANESFSGQSDVENVQ
ncbi:MAG: TerB family tellurite resistance protein, partial [Actinobacteria bacterium]|nr:TerB family tellurite resistance protein [Actinomycetota bacterium]